MNKKIMEKVPLLLLPLRKGGRRNALFVNFGTGPKLFLFLFVGASLSLQLSLVVGVSAAPNNLQSNFSSDALATAVADQQQSPPLRCICDGECETIRAEDCRWGLTLDVCGCCLLCSRGEGEPCGGAVGTCAPPLHCLLDPKHPSSQQQGICSKLGDGQICPSPVQRFGCLFHGENCVCENHWVCPDIDLFLFDTEESCRSRIAILISQQQHHPSLLSHHGDDDDDGGDSQLDTKSLQDSDAVSVSGGSRATGSCTDDGENGEREKCGKVVDCPSDSYRIPSSLHNHQKSQDCCPIVHPCQCNPGLLCSKPSHKSCPPGFRWLREKVDPFLKQGESPPAVSTLGQPGHCCPRWRCSRVRSRRRRRRGHHNLFRSKENQQQSSKQYKFYDKENTPYIN